MILHQENGKQIERLMVRLSEDFPVPARIFPYRLWGVIPSRAEARTARRHEQ